MRLFLLSLLFVGFVAFRSSAQSTVSGRVFDASGKPLAGANILISKISKGDASDADGYFRISEIPAGVHTIEVSYIGYETTDRTITIEANTVINNLDFELRGSGYAMEPLLVRATRATRRTPMTYSAIVNSEIQQQNIGLDAPYIFRWTPSAVETSDAGAGVGYTGIRIRGSDATRINVTINGIPLNDAESQSVYWVNMPDFLSSVDNIQIQRGVGASTNGAGAFGASINLQTNTVTQDPYATVGIGAGSFNTLRRNVEFGSGRLSNGFSIEGRLSAISSDGYIDRASSDLRSWYLGAGLSGKRSLLKFNIFSGQEKTYQAWYGVPGDYLNDPVLRRFNPAGTERPGEPYDNETDNYQQTHYQLLYNTQISQNWNLNLALHYTRGAGYYEQYKADEAFSDYGISDVITNSDTIRSTDLVRRLWLDNHFYGNVFALTWRSDDERLESVTGGAFNIYEGLHYGDVIWAEFAGTLPKNYRFYENDARKTDFNIYQKWNYQFAPGWDAYLDLQYRTLDYRFFGYNRQLEQVDQAVELHFFNPKFGLQFRPGESSVAYASFAVGHREPNRNDFTENTPDTRPLPERLLNTEIGWRISGKKGAIGLNAYHMYYQNQLVVNGQINDVGEYVRINVDQSYRAGLELMAEYQLLSPLKGTLQYTLSRNRIIEFTEFVDVYDADFNWLEQRAILRRNAHLAFSPDHIANASLAWRVFGQPEEKSQLLITMMGKFVSKQFIDNSSDETNILEPYFFSDLRLNYSLKPGFVRNLDFQLLIQNLFDAKFASNAWSYRYIFDQTTAVDRGFFPQAGINFLAGVNISF
jgi:iron complex outermembrane receptor protein